MPSRRFADEGGEWRQLTVMFSDVVGSTRLAAEHDPESVRAVLRAYQETVSASTRRYEGHVAKYLGDGVLVYFGYPTPHEDDPRRAVAAGLDLLARIDELGASIVERYGVELAIRVAVHTGMVIRGDMGPASSPEPDEVVGEALNVAARLQDAAASGGLVISADTQRLVSGYFEVRSLGPIELRGVPAPVEAYEVLGEVPGVGRIEAQPDLSPFVNRDEERGRLERLWRSVADGGSEVALIRGEPGIGKSRLIETFRAAVAAENGAILPFRCSTFQATTHLYPARRAIADACGISLAGDVDGDAAARLQSAFERLDLGPQLPLLAALLGISPGPGYPAPELDGTMLREATLGALVDWIERKSSLAAGMIIVDDAQWADPSTIELLNRIIARRPPGVLVVLTSRNGFEAPWEVSEVLELGPLSSGDLEGIASASPLGESLGPTEVAELARRSDGVPLYFEELLRLAGQPGGRPGPRLRHSETSIPPALLDPLLARLAAPGVELGLIQTLSCVGQEVQWDLIRAVVELEDDQLDALLGRLVEAGLLRRGEAAAPTYHFHHHLLRELAYETQLTPARVERHSRIADALKRGAGGGQADAGLLALHLEQAERTAEAIAAHVSAARVAQSDGAFAEAAESLDRALELVGQIGEAESRGTLELAVRRARGFSMVATLGYAAPQAAAEHERCLELCRKIEPGPEHLPDLIAIWSYYLLHGDIELAEDVIDLVEQRSGSGPNDPPGAVFRAFNRFFRGDFEGADRDLDTYLESAYGQLPATHPEWPLPNDPTVAALTLRGLLAQLQGDSGAAAEAMAGAKARASSLAFPWGPFSMGWALAYSCLQALLADDYETADSEVAELLRLAQRHGFLLFTFYGQLQAAISTLRPKGSGDRDAVDQALAAWRLVGGELWVPAFLTEIAGHHRLRGDLEAAQRALDEATAVAARLGADFWSARTRLALGEARIAGGDPEGAEQIRGAVELAAAQGAGLFEAQARRALSDLTETAR